MNPEDPSDPQVPRNVEKALVIFVTCLLAVVTAAVLLQAEDAPPEGGSVEHMDPFEDPDLRLTEPFAEAQRHNEFGAAEANSLGALAGLSGPDLTDIPDAPEVLSNPLRAPGEGARYVVKAGDSFERIARRLWGTPRGTALLMSANPGVLPRALRPGQPLVLPSETALLALKRTSTASRSARANTVAAGQLVVREGDTLGGIAHRHTGRASRWTELAKSNPRALANPHRIRPGMVLTRPPSW